MPPAKPLIRQEIPAPLRSYLNFASQRTMNGRMHIWAACAECGKERWRAVGAIRQAAKEQTYTGLCCPCHCSGESSPNWAGGRPVQSAGYILNHISLFSSDEQALLSSMCLGSRANYVHEHRAIMALHLGRPLESHECVRHLNGNKTDNRLENLALGTAAENNLDHHILGREVARLRKLNSLLLLMLAVNQDRASL